MSNESPVLTSLTENSTELPVWAGQADRYVLLWVLLCVFAGGSLTLLSVLLLFCHRCCVGGRRYSRASDDPEKTNTTYVEDSQPTQDITIRLNESDSLSASSCHDEATDMFTSTYSTGRRVSFNDSALYDKESKTQDKGRRYTLTEGDFHHLKKARLTHLHVAPPHSTLKILTIMECESTESSRLNVHDPPTPKLSPYTCYQSSEMPAWLGQSSSGALPGDIHHSILLDPRIRHSPSSLCPLTLSSRTAEAIGDRTNRERERGIRGTGEAGETPLPPGPQDSVLQLFCKLTRHASLEGAGPYFRRWRFNSSHRATSLDAKGSPKRHPFQRQRAASDNTDPTEEDSPPVCHDITQSLPHTHSQISGLQRLSAGGLPRHTCSPSNILSRLEVEVVVEAASNITKGTEVSPPPAEPPKYQGRDQNPGEAIGTALLRETGTGTEALAEVGTVNKADAGEEFKVWVGSVEESGEERGAEQRLGTEADRMNGFSTDGAQQREEFQAEIEAEARAVDWSGACSQLEPGMGTERETDASLPWVSVKVAAGETEPKAAAGLGPSELRIEADLGSAIEWSGSSGVYISRQDSSETQPSLYRDIWSLRASLEQYASSDQSSTDRESIRSDADSVCSVGGAAARSLLAGCLSQDLGDEPEGDWEFGDMERDGGRQREPEREEDKDNGEKTGNRGVEKKQSEGGGGGETEAGSRKLLQMDSGYTSIEAPMRAPEELRMFGAPGVPRGKTASERRLFFTSSGRKGSVCESFETKVFNEELEDDVGESAERSPRSPSGGLKLTLKETSQCLSQMVSLLSPQPGPSSRPARLRRRDYSIDEKTDALFNEFLRHDPRFDQQESPLRSRHRSRVHLRQQWQRHKQYSDPGSGAGGRYSPSLERQSFRPLRRGESAGYPLDTRYHSTLSRIASAADEEANEGVASEITTNEGGTGGSKGAACEGTVHDSTDVKESTNKGTRNKTVANEDAANWSSDTLRARASGTDPSVDNYNNNSSQALSYSVFKANLPVALPKPLEDSIDPPALCIEDDESPRLNPHLQPTAPRLSDKLFVTLDDRLYAGLTRTGHDRGPDYMMGTISLSSSPEPSSPV
ncbi:hypothetical protein UPYG_G00295280 [Umbra pygmaea]|uniref:Voltage-dependent calcium channel beta subunit-associated regulatory protein-like n=1 Tax=Umbra pygmaea TaxID=75934 RepID=A0ABD0W731_UMBPY